MSKSATSNLTEDSVAIFIFPAFTFSRNIINFTIYWTPGDSTLSSPLSSSTLPQRSHIEQDIVSYARAEFSAAEERVAKYAAGVYFSNLRDDGVKPNFSRTNVKEEEGDPGAGHATNPTSADTHRVVESSTKQALSCSVASASSGQSVLDLPSQPRIPSVSSNLLHNLPSLAASSSSPAHASHCKPIAFPKVFRCNAKHTFDRNQRTIVNRRKCGFYINY
ncbi:hypothetical protein BD410DRAFT_443894 [Rickenella mellea]|uniref:Uncharacterized protein n=1 Tax=Rickenella mellea TaxID=50990 RepID=A0A4Y7PV43_9AGAM|nr:hypothetical protein BD410DRAFT_443894 [Rickenella mellea]